MPHHPHAAPVPDTRRLLVFDTHPIQYRAPVFRALAQRLPGLQVLFFNETWEGDRWWYAERSTAGITPTGVSPHTEGYRSDVLHTARLGTAGAGRALRDALEREAPHAVLVYGYYLPEHWILRRLCAAKRIPLLFVGETFTRTHSTGVRRIVADSLRRMFFRGVGQFVSIGQKNETFYRGLGIAADRITRARYCVDTSFFRLPESAAAEERVRWRREQELPDDAFVLLFVGRLFGRKRPEDALRLMERLEAHPRVHLVLVGSGPMEEGLRTKAAGNRRVRFAGFLQQAAIRGAYYGSDLLLVPSVFETWGLVVNEAFAAGLPAVVTDTCGVADDLVERGNTGFVYPVGDLGKAAMHVTELLADPERRRRMGEAARKKVESEYSVDGFAEAILDALTKASH